MSQESADLDVLHMRLETLQKQVEDQQEHICVLRDTVSLKDRQADMLHSDVTCLCVANRQIISIISCSDTNRTAIFGLRPKPTFLFNFLYFNYMR